MNDNLLKIATLIVFLFAAFVKAPAAPGDLDPTFQTRVEQSGTIRSAAIQPDGKIIAVGKFGKFNEASRSNIVRLNADGSLDDSFNPGDGANNSIWQVFLQTDGKILICGEFTSFNGVSRTQVARLNADGSLDNSFVPASEVDRLFGIRPLPNGQILAYGAVIATSVNSYGIVRLNADGSLDASFSSSTTLSYVILTCAVQADGKIVIGGHWLEGRGNIARLNPNGSLDFDFRAGTTANGTVNSVAVQPDGKILLAGAFTQVRGFPRPGLARVEADGEFDASFVTGSGFDAAVKSIALQPDGKIVAVGDFQNFNNIAANKIARVNANGTLDATFNAGAGVPATMRLNVLALANYKILVGGDFTTLNNQPKARLAALQSDARILTTRTKFDFDGDGRADNAVYRPTSGAWFSLNSATGFFAAQFGAPGDVIAPADYDGDGRTDLAVFRPSDGTWYISGSGAGTFYGVQFGQTGDIPAPGDFDADGKADIAVFRPSNGTWYVLGTAFGFYAIQFGQAGDVLLTGKFDGDQNDDVAVFRPSDGTWYLLQSSAGFAAYAFGQNGDVPLAGDFNGDGRNDLAVWRPSAASFYVARSLVNPGQNFDSIQFGLSADVPVPADFDGDGKTDIAVYRPSNGAWYRIDSSNGQFNAAQFGISTDTPVPAAFR